MSNSAHTCVLNAESTPGGGVDKPDNSNAVVTTHRTITKNTKHTHSGTNGEFKRLLDADSSQPLAPAFLLAAGCTGLAEASVFTPIDLVRTEDLQ